MIGSNRPRIDWTSFVDYSLVHDTETWSKSADLFVYSFIIMRLIHAINAMDHLFEGMIVVSLVVRKRLRRQAFALLHEMMHLGLQPSLIAVSAVMSACESMGEWQNLGKYWTRAGVPSQSCQDKHNTHARKPKAAEREKGLATCILQMLS